MIAEGLSEKLSNQKRAKANWDKVRKARRKLAGLGM